MRFDPDYDIPNHHTSTLSRKENRIYQRISSSISDNPLEHAKAKAMASALSSNPFTGYHVTFSEGKIVIKSR